MHGLAQLVIGVVLMTWTFFKNLFAPQRGRPFHRRSLFVDDKAKAEFLAAELIAEHKAKGMQANPFLDRLSAVFAWLRGNGVTWGKIIQMAFQVYTIVSAGGGDWNAIIQQIIALFGLPAMTAPPTV